jgi:hypothetical protein
MRALFSVVAAVGILASLVAPAEAGKSRSAHGNFVFAPGATFGSGPSAFSHLRHGSGMDFRHRPRVLFHSDRFVGTIVPPLSGTIVPPFKIGRPFHRDSRLFLKSDRFAGTFVSPFGGTIVPPFQIGRPFHRDLFFRRKHGFDGFFWSGSVGRSQTVIILQQFAVPVAVPEPAAPPVKAQVVQIQPWSETGEVLIFSPSKSGQ